MRVLNEKMRTTKIAMISIRTIAGLERNPNPKLNTHAIRFSNDILIQTVSAVRVDASTRAHLPFTSLRSRVPY